MLSKGEFLKSDLVLVDMSIVVNIGGPNRNDIVLLQRGTLSGRSVSGYVYKAVKRSEALGGRLTA